METPGEGGSSEVLSEQKALPLPLLFLGYNHFESRVKTNQDAKLRANLDPTKGVD
jgi:hypothetical protein